MSAQGRHHRVALVHPAELVPANAISDVRRERERKRERESEREKKRKREKERERKRNE